MKNTTFNVNDKMRTLRAFEYQKAFRGQVRDAIAWQGTDLLHGEQVRSLTIILRTKGCYWARMGGCTMCGYVYAANVDACGSDIQHQFDHVINRYGKDFSIVKLFTSGSFLDEDEVPLHVRNYILHELSNAPKVIMETRPEFVTNEICADLSNKLKSAEVAIGLETSDDDIRTSCINKGFTFTDFITASRFAISNGLTVKAYLLLKPPFLTEQEALSDAITSIQAVSKYADTISLNLCNVQKGTLVEEIWRRKMYRPPWLWTAVEVLKQAKHSSTIICDPIAGGTKRGPHNCGQCDDTVIREIREFSLTQNPLVFKTNCSDTKLWEYVLEFEQFTYGAPLVL